MNQYEAMFLFDPTFGHSFDKCASEVRRLMERAQGEILFCEKWDERRLAYPIKGRKRGVYVLVYFNAPPDRIAGLERDAKLSEAILRLLVIRAEGLTREHMERGAALGREEAAKGRGEGRRGGERERRRASHGARGGPDERDESVATLTQGADESASER